MGDVTGGCVCLPERSLELLNESSLASTHGWSGRGFVRPAARPCVAIFFSEYSGEGGGAWLKCDERDKIERPQPRRLPTQQLLPCCSHSLCWRPGVCVCVAVTSSPPSGLACPHRTSCRSFSEGGGSWCWRQRPYSCLVPWGKSVCVCACVSRNIWSWRGVMRLGRAR